MRTLASVLAAAAHPAARVALPVFALGIVIGVYAEPVPTEPLRWEIRPATAEESRQRDADHLRDLMIARIEAREGAAR
jgi:hypothetical protein